MTRDEERRVEIETELRLRYAIRAENEGKIRFLEALRASQAKPLAPDGDRNVG